MQNLMRILAGALIACGLFAASPVRAADSAGYAIESFTGDIEFDLGGIDVEYLIGTFVKSIDASGVVVLQDANGDEQTIILATGGGMGGGLTTAQVQALVGAMFTSNDETGGIQLTYDSGTQKIDASVTISNATIDVRIANYARVSPSGTIADAQIPSGIARDSELTDDQIAAEVPVSSTAFSGNLSATDTNVQNGVRNYRRPHARRRGRDG